MIRDLIARLYRRDDIDLEGESFRSEHTPVNHANLWQNVWEGAKGLYLVVHGERKSGKSNQTEAEIASKILATATNQADESIGIVTPHRAQRALLQSIVGEHDSVYVIDTVERLQGGERSTVIVSATVSDSTAISKNAEFILDLNRSNVAFSRAKDRLIVICSETLLDHIPSDLDQYQSTLLWKSLRELCSTLLGSTSINGHPVSLYTPPFEPNSEG